MGVASCGGGETTAGGGGGEQSLKVGLAYDIGGRGDKSFNDAAFRGLQRVQKELNLEVKDLAATEGESDADKASRLKLMADTGYNPIIAVGFVYANAVKEVAPKYPNVTFAIVDDETVKGSNVANLVFAEEQASYLVGAAAAAKSEADNIGFVGGVDTPLIKKFEAGYVAGAEKINPDVEVQVGYLSQPPDFSGFRDPAKAKTMADGMYDKGADVVYHAAGLSGNGLFEAAAGQKKWAIGVDSDQYVSAPGDQKQYILTSALKGVDVAVFDFVKSVGDKTFKPGVQRFDLADNGVGYSTSNPEINDVKPRLEELKQQIIDGEITVPTEP
ncbi:MAG: BMP family ABC transporter substrate-binding protein [Streptosporangiales bacterium]|nr:BMP family ABC transporter substrate-binding protein [Streptosporangiales bacterium]